MNKKYLKDVKAIPWKLQHQLVVTEMDKIVKNEQTIRRSVRKLKKNSIKARFQKRVKELADVDVPDIQNYLKSGILNLVMKYVKRKKIVETMGIHDGEMKR